MTTRDVKYTATSVPFRGTFINLSGGSGTCSHGNIGVVHHLDDEGRHYCPTGFVMCFDCGGTAEEPEPAECTLNQHRRETGHEVGWIAERTLERLKPGRTE